VALLAQGLEALDAVALGVPARHNVVDMCFFGGAADPETGLALVRVSDQDLLANSCPSLAPIPPAMRAWPALSHLDFSSWLEEAHSARHESRSRDSQGGRIGKQSLPCDCHPAPVHVPIVA
jgi:hypothetical protein